MAHGIETGFGDRILGIDAETGRLLGRARGTCPVESSPALTAPRGDRITTRASRHDPQHPAIQASGALVSTPARSSMIAGKAPKTCNRF